MATAAVPSATTLALCSRCRLPVPDDAELCRPCAEKKQERLPRQIGPYRVLRRLGRGDRTTVYECADGEGQPTLALKVYSPDPDGRCAAGEKRLREARSWSRLEHPSVVRVHAIGRWCGSPFLAMDKAPGGSVEGLLDAAIPLEPQRALGLVAEAARALEAGSARGLMHRSVKPANLLLAADGSVLLSDPGLAGRLAAEPSRDAVAAGENTTAPELLQGMSADYRADIYALGICLARMIGVGPGQPSGQPRTEPSPLVARLLLRMTAHNREDRFESFAELRHAIADAIETVDPVQIEQRRAASRSWAAAGGLAGFVMAATISAVLPPPGPTLGPVAARPGKTIALPPAKSNAIPPRIVNLPPSYDPAEAEPDAVSAIIRDELPLPASYSYVMGSADAVASFDREEAEGSRRPRRTGGRLQIPSGTPSAWVHRSDLEGDLRSELDVVLQPGASVALELRAADGRRLVGRIRAWQRRPELSQRAALASSRSTSDDAGALLLAGNPTEAVAGVALGVAPGRPHHLELRREGSETRLLVDGKEILRADIVLEGSYRVAITAPEGGAEIRAFACSADRELVPPLEG